MNNNAIGVFDSGVGGMTVLKELMKTLTKILYILGIQKDFLMEVNQKKV